MDGCLCFVDEFLYDIRYLILLLKNYFVIKLVIVDVYERFGYGVGVE